MAVTLDDLSLLYLRPKDDLAGEMVRESLDSLLSYLPLIGPVRISSENVIQGRGLVATRNIKPGECLFAIRPAVQVPVEEVKRVWLGKCKVGETENEKTMKLEQIAETILVKKIKRILKNGDQHSASTSILSQVGDNIPFEAAKLSESTDIDIITGKIVGGEKPVETLSNDAILSIIHKNAFGPDFRHYNAIARNWLTNPSVNPYGRILSLYPLAAMINHSCRPNTTRVYSIALGCDELEEVMVSHATQPIKEGEEILWSYVPTSKPYDDRQQRLKNNFGFSCVCTRCKAEGSIVESNDNLLLNHNISKSLDKFAQWNEKSVDIRSLPPLLEFHEIISRVESILGEKQLSGEVSRFIRAGMTTLYTNYFNVSLSASTTCLESKKEILGLAAQLHLSLATVDHGTTEHLSILHLCYELASQQSRNKDSNKNLSKFWALQLQKAHECRYGRMNGNVAMLKEIMVHTRSVLRNMDGFENAKYCFI